MRQAIRYSRVSRAARARPLKLIDRPWSFQESPENSNPTTTVNHPGQIPITVNDDELTVRPGITILELLDELEIQQRAIAVELNYEIQPKDQFGQRKLQPHDRLEIVTLVGGG